MAECMTHPQRITDRLNISRSHLLVVSVSALLTACGGGAGGSAPAEIESLAVQLPANTVSRLGYIGVTSSNGPLAEQFGFSKHIAEAYADFTDYGQVMTQVYIDERHTAKPLNTCDIFIDSSDDSQDVGQESSAVIDAFESNAQRVSAGDVIGITTTTGPWAELHLNQDYSPYYELQADIDSFGALPQGASLSIPGEDFPGFDAIGIPYVEPIAEASISALNDRSLTVESAFTWSAPTQPNQNGFVVLSMYTYHSNDDTGAEVSVGCILSDNGSFSLPDNVQELVSQYDFEIDSLYFSRFSMTTDIRGDAAVQIFRDSRYLF